MKELKADGLFYTADGKPSENKKDKKMHNEEDDKKDKKKKKKSKD